ncbi:hypothetical protein FKW77_002291 [Venturia effusa]|uniref:Uncharacterized protein n=1 Tax=Venturia effusa TaxID=50376 RepID=A0A517LAH0_9PEZI|nr:hypothetical protein FKW77_002291 [Venturia effusa]
MSAQIEMEKRLEKAHQFWTRVVALFCAVSAAFLMTFPSSFVDTPRDPTSFDAAYYGQIRVDAQYITYLLGISWNLFAWCLVWGAFCEVFFMAPRTRRLYEKHADPKKNRLWHWLCHKIRFLMVAILSAMFCAGLGVLAWAMQCYMPAIGGSGVGASVALFCVFAFGVPVLAPNLEREKDSLA